MSIQNRIYQNRIRLDEIDVSPVTPPSVTPDVGGGDGQVITPDDSGDHDCANCSTTLEYHKGQLQEYKDYLNRLQNELAECISGFSFYGHDTLEGYILRWCGTPGNLTLWAKGCYQCCATQYTRKWNEAKAKNEEKCNSSFAPRIKNAQAVVDYYQAMVDSFNDPDHWCNRNCEGWNDSPETGKKPVSKTPVSAVDPKSVFQRVPPMGDTV
jgi:hypothetical protein